MESSPRSRSVLVAGGTGFLGAAFVRALDDRGHRPVVLSRSPEKVSSRFPGREVEGRAGDVTRPETLEGVLEGIEAVVQTVQFPGFPVEDPSRGRTFREVDGRGTANVAEAASAAGVERLIYLSGAGVDGGEDRPWFEAKRMAERAVREAAPAHTVIRPSWVYGPEDASLNVFARLVRWVPGFFPQLGDGSQRVNPVLVDDVARALVRSLEADAARDVTFEIGGPVTYTMDGVVRVVMDVLGRRKPIVHVPMSLARAGAAVAEVLPGRPLSRQALAFATQDAVADPEALRGLFPGLEPTPLPEALEGYLAG